MSRNNTSKLLSFTQSSGVELNFNLILEEKLTRQQQKLETLTQYVQKYPSGWKKRLELADLLYSMGRLEQAVEEYRSCLVQKPQLLEVRLKLGKILQLMGRKTEAVEVYETALSMSISPLFDGYSFHSQGEGTVHSVGASSVEGLFQVSEATHEHIRGLIAICQDDTEGAILALESAVNLESSNPSHWLVLGQVQMEREDAVAANSAFGAVLSLKQDDLVALLASYDALLLLGHLREAESCLSQLSELAPDHFQVLKRLAHQCCRRRLLKGKEGKQTKQIITAALKLAPNAPDAHDLLAQYHIFRGEWEKGLEVLQQFTESHPNNPNGWYFYGRCLFHTGEYQKAVKAMLVAHGLYPDDGEIYRGLCEIVTSPLAGHGRGDNLAALVEEMLERFPQRWSVWATMGRSLVECLGEFERGCRVSEEATRLQPHLPDAWFCHGRVLALAHKHREAVEVLEKGWELSKLHLIPSKRTSLFLPKKQERQLLRWGGSRPYSKWPDEVSDVQFVSAAVWLGESSQALGDDGMSRRWWKKGCDLAEYLRYFDPVMADYWQGRAFECLGNLMGAAEAYERALNEQLLFPLRGEVKVAVKRLKDRMRKAVGS